MQFIKQHPYITATLVATLLAIVVWTIMPKEYTAVTKLSDEYKEMDLAIGLNDIKAHLKQVMGNGNSGMNDMEVYCKVLKTEDFARSIAQKQVPEKRMTYGEYLGERDTIKAIQDRIIYNYSRRQGTLIISFSDRNPIIAYQMLDSVTAHLQEIVTVYRHEIADAALQNALNEMNNANNKYIKAESDYTVFADSHNESTSQQVNQQKHTLEKEAQIAYKEYKDAATQYVRQLSLKKRSYASFAVIENNSVPRQPNSYFISYFLSFIIIALLITYGIRLYKKHKVQLLPINWGNISSPWTLSVTVWASILAFYYLLDTDLYPITNQFYYSFFLWLPIFCFCAITTYNLLPSHLTPTTAGHSFEFNRGFFTFFFIISLVITPLYVYRVMQTVMMFSTDDLMNNIRTLAIYGEGQGLLNHSVVINEALFIVALWAYPKVPLWQVIALTIECLLNALAIMEKGTMFFVFICIIFVLFEKKIVKMRTIIIAGAAIMFFFFFFNVQRSTNEYYDASETTLIDFISMYILSPPVAFSQLQIDVTPQFGSNTFETIYHFLKRFGITGIIEKEKIQEFIWVPICTNVYTVFQPFYIDFGFRGVAFFSMIYGVVGGWLYRLYQNGNTVGTCMYTFFAQILILQFYQENVFQSIVFVLEFAFFITLVCQKTIKLSV
ncbi:MAG: oligosaccharide repeat unit polymerase [Bacteroidaceae bacterium]|nr:oligosaccharide repeat unit polymerase [Bacteroidaceae bacterium]